ncbi:MAG: aldehyde:ferredoxin oxidoreductase, partial [Proteobacteria bacterium]|nr:aldehyde:ferredoxin oxidoreductase [Pseudomonadota bacterium]MBU1698372.1 aldehyde:ferredoxin oxidoreductase [Pseudomonadota bacterium]
SRQKRYDDQLKEKYDLDISNMSSKDKVAALRQRREEQYELLKDAVYERRGWDNNGIPTIATVKRLGIDFPEVMEVLKKNGVV